MNKTSTFFSLFFCFLLTISTFSFAQGSSSKIHPALQEVLNNSSADDFISVYAVLVEQYSLNDLMNQTSYLPRKEKQKAVTQILKEFAAEKQQAVLTYLENTKQENLVSNIDILWAANTVVFTATPQVIYGVANNFDEVAEIRYDPVIDETYLIDSDNKLLGSNNISDGDNPAPQQGLILINAPAVWAAGDSGKGVLVANLDTGCDWDHPDLIHNIWNNLGEDSNGNNATVIWNGSAWVFDPGDINGIDDDSNGKIDDFIGWDYSGNDNDPYNPSSTHGTKTSGIVCGDGTNGTQTGVAPKANIMILRPSGESQYWLAQQYAIDNGADVITSSLSYKWYFSPQPNYPMFRQMTDVELAAGVVHTNSTSNDGNNLGNAPIPYNISAPGNCPPSWLHPDQTLIGGLSSVIGVGNVNASTDVIQSSSPYGPSAWEDIQSIHPGYPYAMPTEYQDYPFETLSGSMGLLKPDVSSPGQGTVSTTNGGGYASFSGTSAATPHVAGVVALILSINPELMPSDVSRIIQLTSVEKGVPGKDPRYGAGRIDAYEAYLQALSEVPVELTSFSAHANENKVILNWQTATEINNQGFEIQRKAKGNFIIVGFIPGHGTTTEVQSYSFTDDNVIAGSYSYRLKQVDYDGTINFSDIINVDVTGVNNYFLAQNYPNPFNPNTTISFAIAEDGMVTLRIFDVLGNEVKTLINEERTAGAYNAAFDASYLSSGVYYYQLTSGSFTSTKKLILMK
ncbi:major intracellular serine protease precursor [bacterium BMS3Abin03]|nr:major intracellular serine protease precursor [bacterium BMS3Abin03]HDZ58504.1 T9SS type A sorting domain-containing protein [Ignavibacteriales bacterium]